MAFKEHSLPRLFHPVAGTAGQQGDKPIAPNDRNSILTDILHSFKDAPVKGKKQCRLLPQELHIQGKGIIHLVKGIDGGKMRRLTNFISEGFIWSVGITRPKPGKERIAALYITLTLAASVLVAVAMFLLLLQRL